MDSRMVDQGTKDWISSIEKRYSTNGMKRTSESEDLVNRMRWEGKIVKKYNILYSY